MISARLFLFIAIRINGILSFVTFHVSAQEHFTSSFLKYKQRKEHNSFLLLLSLSVFWYFKRCYRLFCVMSYFWWCLKLFTFIWALTDCWYMWAATWQNEQSECAPSEDSDQPGHSPSLIRVFAVRMKKPWVLSYPLSARRRLWSDWADAQADLSLRWAHTHFVGFIMSRLM